MTRAVFHIRFAMLPGLRDRGPSGQRCWSIPHHAGPVDRCRSTSPRRSPAPSPPITGPWPCGRTTPMRTTTWASCWRQATNWRPKRVSAPPSTRRPITSAPASISGACCWRTSGPKRPLPVSTASCSTARPMLRRCSAAVRPTLRCSESSARSRIFARYCARNPTTRRPTTVAVPC